MKEDERQRILRQWVKDQKEAAKSEPKPTNYETATVFVLEVWAEKGDTEAVAELNKRWKRMA